MGVTLFTFVLLPLCAVWATSPDRLLQLMAVVSCFEAAAAVTVGAYGLQPGLAPALVFIAYMMLQMLLGARFPALPATSRVLLPFVAVTIYAVITSYLMPRLFEYQTYVWPQKPAPPFVLSMLTADASNLNQDIYLIVDCVFLIVAAAYLANSKRSLEPFIRAYFLGGFLAAGVSAWQFASLMLGLPFPESLFYSNTDWAILTGQTVGLVPRINGPFTEPSALASYMASIVCAAGWLLLKGRRDRTLWLLLGIGLLTMAVSTSATGFTVLAIVAICVPVFALLTGSARMMAAVVKIAWPMAIFGGLAFFAVAILVPSIGEHVQEIAMATFNKQESTSYEDRTGADLDSLAALADTYGLGVGWGTNRSSSLIPGLLAGLGVPGVLLLLWFVFGVLGRVHAARRIGGSSDQMSVMDACTGGLVGFLLSAMLSGPTITSPVFFLLLALLIASAIRIRLDQRPAAPRWTAGLSLQPDRSTSHAVS